MKKIGFTFVLVFLFSVQLFSQEIRFGLRTAPNISYNRVTELSASDNEADGFTYERDENGLGIRFSGGAFADIFFHDNYAFSTGFFYTVKRVSLDFQYFDTDAYTNLQYGQIPATMKLFTNEVSRGLRVFFQLGGTFDMKLAEKYYDIDPGDVPDQAPDAQYREYREPDKDQNIYQFPDVSLFVGGGMEYELGDIIDLYGGISYQRGLMSVTNGNKDFTPLTEMVDIKNDLINLELGVIFNAL